MRSPMPMRHAWRLLRTALHKHGQCLSLVAVFTGSLLPSVGEGTEDAPATLAQGSCPPNWPSCAPGESLFDSNTRGSGWHGLQQRSDETEEPRPGDRSKAKDHATYRTLCVRLCDGYYWPISYATTRAHFRKDARQCGAMCAADTKLYVHRNPGETPDDMVDLEGGKYADLPNAYHYRFMLINDCSCKPPPWSKQERLRHASYAKEDGKTTDAVTEAIERRAAMATMAAALGSETLKAVNERHARDHMTR